MKVFVETQRFDQWWFRVIVVVIMAITLWPLFSMTSEISLSNTEFWVVTILCGTTVFILVWLLFFLKLKTKIDEHGVQYGFFPFNRKMKQIAWKEIEQISVRKYKPIREYGGWGYRAGLGKKSGAMNVKGNIGIQIVLQDQKKLLIGTQKERDAKRVIQTYSHKINAS